jgi:hypothetical protein
MGIESSNVFSDARTSPVAAANPQPQCHQRNPRARRAIRIFWIIVFSMQLPPLAQAEPERWSFNAGATGVLQQGFFDDAVNDVGGSIGDTGRGSFALDLNARFNTSSRTRIFAAASFAQGDGLNGAGGVSLRTNADDLEDDVKNVNGRSRNYLLEANFAGRKDFTDSLSLEITGGLIDATRYVDANRLANNEISQFMNETFVNRIFLPSYDPGIAISLKGDRWTLNGVWMSTRTNQSNGSYQNFDFFAVDAGTGYRIAGTSGTFRISLATTSESFGEDHAAVHGASISVDHELTRDLGLFARVAILSDEPAVLVHKSLFSGGAALAGDLFGLPRWTAGLAYAYLEGVDDEPGAVQDTSAWEAYARWDATDRFALSTDLQRVGDRRRGDKNPRLWAIGLRFHYAL